MIHTIYGRGFDSNIYLVEGETTTIVDTGSGFYYEEVFKELKKLIILNKIEQIILTHEHLDHTGGVTFFKRRIKDVKILAHRETAKALRNGIEPSAYLFSLPYPKTEVDNELKEGDRIRIGDHIYTVLYTPGHSKGSICLYCEEEGILFSGDTVFSQGGIGRYDLPGGDLYELEKSIKRLSELNVKHLYPGHGEIVNNDGHKHIRLSLRNVMSI